MKCIRNLVVAAALLAAGAVLVGCSADDPLTPTASSISANEAIGTVDGFSLEEFARRYGVDCEPTASADKRPHLPSPLLVAAESAAAVGVIQNQGWFAPETIFQVDALGDVGFMLTWLVDDPDETDPNRYLAHIMIDIPASYAVDPQVVAPYTAPVEGATNRILNLLSDPHDLTSLPTINDNPAYLYDYHFMYPDDTAATPAYRVYRLTCFRMGFNG
jgi:hypothetical protein